MNQQEKTKKYNNINKSLRMFYGELLVFSVFTAVSVLMILHYYGYGGWVMDKTLYDFAATIRNPVLDSIFKFITYTGETVPVIIMVLIVVILFLYFKRHKEAALVAFYMVGVWRLNEFLKVMIGRPRPDESFHLVETTGLSLPSGHSMNFMAFTLLSLYFIWIYSRNRRWSIGLTVILSIYALLVGLSRVYLNVHYISDVLTGWALGAACAAVAVIIHRIWTESKMDDKPGE